MKVINETKLAKELIRYPSVTPLDAGVIRFLEKKLKKMGFKTKIIEFREKNFEPVKNLYAKLGTKGPNFCFAGHLDVVPPGNTKEWSVNPFKASIKKGHLIGRGANDMKGAIAAFVSAVSLFLIKNNKFNGSISFLITGDEEGLAAMDMGAPGGEAGGDAVELPLDLAQELQSILDAELAGGGGEAPEARQGGESPEGVPIYLAIEAWHMQMSAHTLNKFVKLLIPVMIVSILQVLVDWAITCCQGRSGTARTRGPADLWHGTARKILARKILARPGTENIGTERYWHDMTRKHKKH